MESPDPHLTPIARKSLQAAAMTWFCVAAIGQIFFAYYILIFYGGSALAGEWHRWTQRLIVGFTTEDVFGNLQLVLHIALAFIITIGGLIQFIPMIRRHFPAFHRWNGRVYGITAVLISLGALYLTWVRGMAGPVPQIGISINGLLILIFAVMTVRLAIKRNFVMHHRWALRLFIAVSGVWFFRIGFGFWLIATSGTMPGVGPMLNGPFDYFLTFGCYGVPLIILEIYQRARDGHSNGFAFAAAALVFLGALVTGIGIYGAAMMFWLPNLA